MADNQELINKYRPLSFEEVLGNEGAVAALQRVIKTPSHPHCYLFSGPSGVGKTTLAEIVAREIGAEMIPIDAASNSGIDNIRQLIEMGQHLSLYGAEAKMFIIDECHGLSKPAMNALLLTTERPPAHLYFALCTTEPTRLLETLITRCYHVSLRKVKDVDIELLLSLVCEAENWRPQHDVIATIVQAATGQPRLALTLLQSCYDAPSREEAKRIISLREGSEPLIELLQLLMSGNRSWAQIQPLLACIEDEEFDGAGLYILAGMIKEPNEKKAAQMWSLVEALVYPVSTFNKRLAFGAAIGRMLWSGG